MITSIHSFIELPDEETDVYLPSPERIRQMCAEYQQDWTDRERVKRSSDKPQRWTAPEVSFCLEPSSTTEE